MSTKIAIFEAFIILILFGALYVTHDLLKDKERGHAAAQSAHQEELKQSEARRIAAEAHSDSLQAAEKTFREKMTKDAAVRERAFKETIKEQDTRIADLKATRDAQGVKPDPISQKIESELEAKLQAQKAELEALHVDGEAAEKSYESSLADMKVRLDSERETSVAKDLVIKDLETSLAISEKKVKGWKIVAGIIAGVLIFEEFRD